MVNKCAILLQVSMEGCDCREMPPPSQVDCFLWHFLVAQCLLTLARLIPGLLPPRVHVFPTAKLEDGAAQEGPDNGRSGKWFRAAVVRRV